MKQITFYGATDEGKVRTNNEDAFIAQYIWDRHHVLTVAIDGLGGYEGGEVAAEWARSTIIEYLEQNSDGKCLDLLKQAVTEANNKIVTERQKSPDRNRMGCVLTAGLFELDSMTLNVAHVGDSRLYQYHNGDLVKLTHDHSLVGYREDTGELTEEQAMNHPQRNIVERIVGDKTHMLDDKNFIEAARFTVEPGARFVFCSDGLSDMINKAAITAILERTADVQDCADELIWAAKEAGGKDNVTVVVVQVGEASHSEHSEVVTPDVTQGGHESVETTAGTGDAYTATVRTPSRVRRKRLSPIALTVAALTIAALGFGGGYLTRSSIATRQLQEKDSVISLLKDTIELQNATISDLYTHPNDSTPTLTQDEIKKD